MRARSLRPIFGLLTLILAPKMHSPDVCLGLISRYPCTMGNDLKVGTLSANSSPTATYTDKVSVSGRDVYMTPAAAKYVKADIAKGAQVSVENEPNIAMKYLNFAVVGYTKGGYDNPPDGAVPGWIKAVKVVVDLSEGRGWKKE